MGSRVNSLTPAATEGCQRTPRAASELLNNQHRHVRRGRDRHPYRVEEPRDGPGGPHGQGNRACRPRVHRRIRRVQGSDERRAVHDLEAEMVEGDVQTAQPPPRAMIRSRERTIAASGEILFTGTRGTLPKKRWRSSGSIGRSPASVPCSRGPERETGSRRRAGKCDGFPSSGLRRIPSEGRHEARPVRRRREA